MTINPETIRKLILELDRLEHVLLDKGAVDESDAVAHVADILRREIEAPSVTYEIPS